jgi:hypothetical protein
MKGNGYRPKANDPDGWANGENRPSVHEYEHMIAMEDFRQCPKKVRIQFKTYEHREMQKMKTEDQMSKLISFAEREKEKNEAAAALHVDQLEHQAESMEAQFLTELAKVEAAQKVVEVLVEKKVVEVVVVNKEIYVEVDVLPEGAPRPPPKFIGGQSVHQWWGSWMAGAHEAPSGIRGKHGRPAWYSASVFLWEQFCLQACRDAGVPRVALCGE